MKKLFAQWAVCLLALNLLTACGASAQVLPAQETSLIPEAGSPGPAAAVHYVVGTHTLENVSFDRDKTQLAHYRYDLPEMTAVRSDGTEIVLAQNGAEKEAVSKVETFNRRFEEWAEDSNFDDTVQAAREDLARHRESGLTWLESYEEELSFSVWQTDHLVSIAANYYSYTGGAHPNTALLSWNFDLNTGKFVTPLLLAADDQAFLDGVKEEIIRQAEETARKNGYLPKEFYWENYADIAAEWNNYAVSFDGDGMKVGFSPYELASYAAGTQIFTIGYQTISPWLSDSGRQELGLAAG